MVAALVLALSAGRGATFSFDEWDFVAIRLGWGADTLLAPHNDHLSLVPVIIYKLVLETAGFNGYAVLRVLAALLDLTCGLLFFAYLRERIGVWLAVGLATTLVTMGPGAWDIVWPFQIGFLGSVAAGIGAFIALGRRTPLSDACACALAILALACSGIGVCVLVGVTIELLWRRDPRRWWIAGVPAALYGVWYAGYGASTLAFSRLGEIPIDVWGGLTASSAAITGMPRQVGGGLALVVIAVTAVAVRRAPEARGRLFALAAVLVAFWVFIGLDRGIAPEQSRYLYPTGVFVALLAAEASRAISPPRGYAPAVLTVLLAAGAVHNATTLGWVGDVLRANAHTTRVALTAADQMAGPRIDPAVAIPGVPYLTLGRWETLRRRYGSHGWSPSELAQRPAADRAAVRLVRSQLESRPATGRAGGWAPSP